LTSSTLIAAKELVWNRRLVQIVLQH